MIIELTCATTSIKTIGECAPLRVPASITGKLEGTHYDGFDGLMSVTTVTVSVFVIGVKAVKNEIIVVPARDQTDHPAVPALSRPARHEATAAAIFVLCYHL